MAKIVKWLFLVVFLVVIYVIASEQVSADAGLHPPPPTASTNVRTVSAGSAFTIKCQMPDNYIIEREIFEMNFFYDINGNIARYTIPGKQITAK